MTAQLSIRGIHIEQVSNGNPTHGLFVRGKTSLTPSEAQLLRDWLTWWLCDGHVNVQPTEPDTIMHALERQRAKLLKLADEHGDDGRFITGISHGVSAIEVVMEVMRG